MENIEYILNRIYKDLKENLSEKRFCHSIGVMKKAEELAKKYGIDIGKAKLVGLAHDIAKEMPKEEKIKYVKENNIEIDQYEAESPDLLHAKIGADICKNRYNFTEDMQNAIKYHTVGNPNMDELAKIIFVADKTEEGRRQYIDFKEVEQCAKLGLNSEFIHALDMSIIYTIEKGKKIHIDSINTRNKFLR